MPQHMRTIKFWVGLMIILTSLYVYYLGYSIHTIDPKLTALGSSLQSGNTLGTQLCYLCLSRFTLSSTGASLALSILRYGKNGSYGSLKLPLPSN